jgi:hypothetical protein
MGSFEVSNFTLNCRLFSATYSEEHRVMDFTQLFKHKCVTLFDHGVSVNDAIPGSLKMVILDPNPHEFFQLVYAGICYSVFLKTILIFIVFSYHRGT